MRCLTWTYNLIIILSTYIPIQAYCKGDQYTDICELSLLGRVSL